MACALVVLIKESAAASRPTVAVQLALVILNGELVVVGQLFSTIDLPQGKDDYVLATVHINDTRVAVWLTRVVDETSGVALHCCVHHVKVINAEHVATDSLKETERFHHGQRSNTATTDFYYNVFFFFLQNNSLYYDY